MSILEPFIRPIAGIPDLFLSILSGGTGARVQGTTQPVTSTNGTVAAQQQAALDAHRAREGTTSPPPQHVVAQRVVAASQHTSTGEGTLPKTAQQGGNVFKPPPGPRPHRGGKGRLI